MGKWNQWLISALTRLTGKTDLICLITHPVAKAKLIALLPSDVGSVIAICQRLNNIGVVERLVEEVVAVINNRYDVILIENASSRHHALCVCDKLGAPHELIVIDILDDQAIGSSTTSRSIAAHAARVLELSVFDIADVR